MAGCLCPPRALSYIARGMSFWKSLPGAVLVVVLVGAVVGTCALGYEVQRVTHPPRPAEAAANLGV